MKIRVAVSTTSVLAAGLLTGCGPGAADLPLPGTTVAGKSYELTAEFDDALNLAVGAKVKVNGVDVGRVKSVKPKDFRAVATLRVKENAGIRRGATARLRYNTPLGELFVDVRSPRTGPVMGPGAVMAPSSTTTAPTVEDALASVSLLVNGGGLGQLKTITSEVNTAVSTRGPAVRSLLARTDTFLQKANATSAQFDRALRALEEASGVLNKRRATIVRAVREITPASRVLRRNTTDMVALLEELKRLSRKANTLVGATRGDLLLTIDELGEVLDTFHALSAEFRAGLDRLTVGARFVDRTIQGDWAPLWLNLEVAKTLVGLPGGGQVTVPPIPALPTIPLPTIPWLPLPPLPLPPLPDLLGLGDLPGLPGPAPRAVPSHRTSTSSKGAR